MYSMEVIKAQKEFEDITDARIVIQNAKSNIIFYFKKEEYMELSRESNVTQKHLQIYRFVSKSENNIQDLLDKNSLEQKPLYSQQQRVSISMKVNERTSCRISQSKTSTQIN